MNDILLNIGGFSVYSLSLMIVFAYFWYSFILYKKGLELHYLPESLFNLAVLSGAFGWLGARAGFVVENLDVFRTNVVRTILLSEYPGYSYLGLILGLVLAVIISVRKEEIKYHDGLDLLGLGLPGAVALERLGRVLVGQTSYIWSLPLPIELLQSWMFLLIFVWLWRLERSYRTFTWYRYHRTQARSGFIFGSFLFLSGIVMILVREWLGVAGLLLGMMVIYRRSGRSLIHDVKLLPFVGGWYTKGK